MKSKKGKTESTSSAHTYGDSMMRRRTSVMRFGCFLLLLCLTSLTVAGKITSLSNAQQTVTVSVLPSSVSVPVNKSFTINVTVSGVADLYGWYFQLDWNSSLLNVLNVSEGPFLQAGGTTFFEYSVNATDGSMIVYDTLTGSIPGVSGDGTLATMTFEAQNVGQCPISLQDVELADSSDQPISCQVASGYGYFTPQHDIAVTQVTAAPMALLPGGVVNINVTVQNDGGFSEVFNVTVYINSQAIGVQPVSLGIGAWTIVAFAWDTTGLQEGDYFLLASATLPPEENTTNNSMQMSNPITLLYDGHDVAVTDAEPLRTVVGQSLFANVTATVKDYGIFSETFNTTIYANSTAIYTQTVSLQSGTWTTLTVTWNTTEFAYGNYTISAYASPVPGETNTSNNNFTGSWIIVSIIGDITGSNGWPDGLVNMKDVAAVGRAFGSTPGNSNWNPNADLDNNGIVNMKDIALVARHFGQQLNPNPF